MIRIDKTLSGTLNREQIEFFHRYGFLHFPNFLNQEAVRLIISSIKEVEARWISEGRKSVNGIPLKFGKNIDNTTIIQRMAFASLFHPVLHELLQDPRLKSFLPLLGQEGARIGENEKDGMVINHFVNCKYSQFRQMGWHTDGVRDLFYGKKVMPMINVGIHLDDYPMSNGGLRLIPGTHKQGVFKMLFYKKYMNNKVDKREIGFEIKAGDLTIHDGRLWHRVAKSNVTGEKSRRRVIYVPFVTGEYKPKDENSTTPIYHKFQHLVK